MMATPVFNWACSPWELSEVLPPRPAIVEAKSRLRNFMLAQGYQTDELPVAGLIASRSIGWLSHRLLISSQLWTARCLV